MNEVDRPRDHDPVSGHHRLHSAVRGPVRHSVGHHELLHGDRRPEERQLLDVVAPGIAEALIATAIGLVAAIPAVMAYNYFLRRIHVFQTEMDAFQSDYLNIVRRHFLVN